MNKFFATILMLISLTTFAQQNLQPENNTSLTGTTLTYYQRPSFGQCQADCGNNPNCNGYTWIQAGTYNRSDAAMCYLLSGVTGRAPAAGHISGIKSAPPPPSSSAESNTSLTGTTLTYYQRPNLGQCQADCGNNPNCNGYTWIQAGTYNRTDAAMCYLLSAVTGRSSAAGHYSGVKAGSAGRNPGGSSATQINWGTNAVALRGKNGQRFSFTCSSGSGGSVWGTDVYTDDSSICNAAVHAGLITTNGGTVTIEIRGGQSSYAASTRYGITSTAYASWHGSFFFVR